MRVFPVLCTVLIVCVCILSAGCTNTGTTAETDPLIGTFHYSENVQFLGDQGSDRYSLYYVFEKGGTGSQVWIPVNAEGTVKLPLTWKNTGNGHYLITVTDPDGTLFEEELVLENDRISSVTDTANDGDFGGERSPVGILG